VLCVGCGGSSAHDPLVDARANWSAAKVACGTYSYVRLESNFGHQSFTSVEVTGDTPTRRHYADPLSPGMDFDERGAEIGTHMLGAPAETMEQLLDECAGGLHTGPDSDLCPKADSCTFTLMLDERGVPKDCQHMPKGSAIEGTLGISLTTFACAPLVPDGTVPAS